MAGIGSPFGRRAGVVGAGGSSVLATMLASMSSGQWQELTGSNRPTNMDLGLLDTTVVGDEECTIPYAAHCSYNPITAQVWGWGADHDTALMGGARFWRYDIATNTFLTSVQGSRGSHQYQHSVTNETTGDFYTIMLNHDVIAKWNGSTDFDDLHAMPYGTSANLVATAADWWPGKGVVWIDGNIEKCSIYDPTGASWSTFATSVTAYSGVYHNVSAYSHVHDCLLHGGGNGGSTPTGGGGHPLNTKIYKLTTGGSNSYIADAPYHLGIFHGMTFCGDGAGEFVMVGADNTTTNDNECWKVTSTGTVTQETSPPNTTLKSFLGKSVTTCAINDLGCMVFIDFQYSRSPDRARMYVRKA